ncbi:unnamed protein product [Tetraodon nigroviridis]|uniref:(spotted green pufferfish) hypothetical protein n=1 Tax=Tetraodon nigroviridis TaxID=99883 RepID=Q4SUP0_TETNG|nr:unnamed protein product [Tetraodon nigroviridis]
MKKHKASDSVVPSVRSANLSALKKRWEQPSGPSPAQPTARPPAASRLVPLRQDRQPPAGGQAPQGEGGMDRERPEIPEEQVPGSSYGKARMPLNNLKMKFERGDGAPSKVIKGGLECPSVLDRVLESTSTKEKMAKYQAAVSKQSSAPPVSSHSTVDMATGRASRGAGGSEAQPCASVQRGGRRASQSAPEVLPLGEGDVHRLSEDGLPSGEAGGAPARLPQDLFPLPSLQDDAQSGELRLAAGKHLLQAPFQPAVQSQGQLRRGLRPPASQRAVGAPHRRGRRPGTGQAAGTRGTSRGHSSGSGELGGAAA